MRVVVSSETQIRRLSWGNMATLVEFQLHFRSLRVKNHGISPLKILIEKRVGRSRQCIRNGPEIIRRMSDFIERRRRVQDRKLWIIRFLAVKGQAVSFFLLIETDEGYAALVWSEEDQWTRALLG